MKKIFLAMLFTAAALFVVMPKLSWAADTAATFKAKCAMCHGADGKAETTIGKKMNIPSFASDKVKKMSDAEVEDFIANGGKEKKAAHAYATKGVDAKAMVGHVRSLGK